MLREQPVDVVHHGVPLGALVVAQDEHEVQPLRRQAWLARDRRLAPAGAASNAAVATTAANATALAALPPM